MNDDELPIHAEVASAYLDGELDETERATAAADPHVMTLVDSFTRLRDGLGRVEPVVDSTRTAAMAAALAEFDAVRAMPPAAVHAPALGRITSLWSRRRVYRVVTSFAAAAVVVVIGIAALNSTGSDQKTSSLATVAPASADAAAGLPSSKSADTTAAAAPAGTAAAPGVLSANSAVATIPTIDDAAALAHYASNLEAGARSGSPTTVLPGAASPGPTVIQPPIAAAAPPVCLVTNEIVLGSISVRGIPAFAVRDAVDGTLRAIDAFDCRVLIPPVP
jgi:negative regulator of sigma E activity